MNSPAIESEPNLFELFFARTPIGRCRKEGVCLFKSDDGDVCFAISDSTRPFVVDAMRRTIGVPKNLLEEVLTRIKVAGRMDIAEKRLPQDGRATVRVGSRVIDLRIASMPSSNGERIAHFRS